MRSRAVLCPFADGVADVPELGGVFAVIADIHWTVTATLTSATLAASLLTFLHASWRNVAIRRADLVRNYTKDLYESAGVADLFMDIDHERFSYEDGAFLGTTRELNLIHLLDLLNAVGHSVKCGVIAVEDIRSTTIGYACVRVWRNSEVQRYLAQIASWDVERDMPTPGFAYVEPLAQDIEAAHGKRRRAGSVGHSLALACQGAARQLRGGR